MDGQINQKKMEQQNEEPIESRDDWKQIYTYQEVMDAMKDKISMSEMIYSLKPFKKNVKENTVTQKKAGNTEKVRYNKEETKDSGTNTGE